MKNFKKLLSFVLCLVITFSFGISVLGADDEYIPVAGVLISETELSMYYGESAKLSATVVPANASDGGITWTSSNPTLLSVDADGNLLAAKDTAETPTGKQQVTITATSTFNPKISAKCIVTIDNDAKTKTIAVLKTIFKFIITIIPTIIALTGGNITSLFDAIKALFVVG